MTVPNRSRKIFVIPLLVSILSSLCISLTVYLLFIQTPIVSRREIMVVVLLFLALIPCLYIYLVQYVLPWLKTYPSRKKWSLLLFSALFGVFILQTTNHPAYFFLMPNHTLTVVVPKVTGPESHLRTVSITGFSNGWQDVSFSQFEMAGDWEREPNRISHKGSASASLNWYGRVISSPSIQFETFPGAGVVDVIWDGESEQYDIKGTGGETVVVTAELNNSPRVPLEKMVVFLFSSLFFFGLTIALLEIQLRARSKTALRRFSWLFYALPMIAVWSVFLLTFFPGMMSTDSNDQWRQVITGQFNDAHPVFHTLFLWLITRLWFSPAAVVIAQILFLSLTAAWGIRLLEEHGLPRWASWLVSVIFAIAPLNANMVIVLWKDIPYSTSLFLFSLMILKIVLTKGDWLQKPLTWVWLGLVSLAVTSFRHNGLPIPFVTLLLLMVFYRRWWKQLVQTLVLTLFLYGIIHGPFYTWLNVEKNPSGFVQKIMMHHIAAHIETGKPLTSSEQALADTIFPREKWRYTSCSALSLEFQPGYSSFETPEQESSILKLFIGLVLKEPLVELRHLARVSSIVWRSPSDCGANTLLPINTDAWISILPEKYVQENSLVPILQKPLARFLVMLRNDPGMTLFVAPAVYLWFGIYATAILAIRKKQWKILFFLLPVVMQAAIFIVINISDNFRYHYAVYLVGIFGIGLLNLSLVSTTENTDGSIRG